MTSPALRDALESRATYCDELAQQTVGGVREMHRTNAEMFRKAYEALRANSSDVSVPRAELQRVVDRLWDKPVKHPQQADDLRALKAMLSASPQAKGEGDG
jgi:phosphate uptake regulator